jgi:hypothetical protein
MYIELTKCFPKEHRVTPVVFLMKVEEISAIYPIENNLASEDISSGANSIVVGKGTMQVAETYTNIREALADAGVEIVGGTNGD